MLRHRSILKEFRDIRSNLQALPAESITPDLKELFSTLSKQISECCPELEPYIRLEKVELDALFEKNKLAFTQHMQAPHTNQKWALAFVAELHFRNFLTQSINLPNTEADTIYIHSLQAFKNFLAITTE